MSTPAPRTVPNLEPSHLGPEPEAAEPAPAPTSEKPAQPGSIKALRNAAEAAAAGASTLGERTAAERKARMQQRDYTFQFKCVTPTRTYEGAFTNHAPTIRKRRDMGILRAQLGGGIPFDVLDPFTRELNMILAHLETTLDEKARPDWAADLDTLEDTAPIYALWEEVQQHEVTFLGPR